jgi:hypothetical protein
VHQVAEITALTPLDVRRTEYWSPTIAPSNIEFSPDGGGIPGWEEVAVGTLIAEHPPAQIRRAKLPHRAPASGS